MATITTSVGSPGAMGAASGGRTFAFNNISTSPQQVMASNPSRQSLTFHNPGTVDVFIAPASVVNTGSDVALVPSTGALGGCIRVFAGATMVITGECQKAWQAFAATGTINPLTVIESNI